MTDRGSAFLLKASNRDTPETFTTIAGLRVTAFRINGEVVSIRPPKDGWQQLETTKGVRSVSVSGAGVFTGSTAEARFKNAALSGALETYQLSFESGERLQGQFLATKLDYCGDFNGERSYALSLESSGPVVQP